jgi:transcriptional regulator with XRE-family HTH domain
MRDEVVGRVFRMTRLRRGWTQSELAARAGVSESTISRIEGGEAGRYRLRVVQRHGNALTLRVEIQVAGRGGDTDRPLDDEHAAIVEHVASLLARDGWLVDAEPSYNIYGERGRIDLLAFHPTSETVLVVEVKTEITDLQALFGSLDAKARIAPRLAAARGWDVDRVATLIAVADVKRNRRIIRSHPTLFGRFERHGGRIRAWMHRLRQATLSLLLYVHPRSVDRKQWLATKRRVRRHATDKRGAPAIPGSLQGIQAEDRIRDEQTIASPLRGRVNVR